MCSEDLVEVVGLAEQRSQALPHRLVRLLGARGHHHRDGVGAGIGAEDVDEGPGVEHPQPRSNNTDPDGGAPRAPAPGPRRGRSKPDIPSGAAPG